MDETGRVEFYFFEGEMFYFRGGGIFVKDGEDLPVFDEDFVVEGHAGRVNVHMRVVVDCFIMF